jgi:L-phenylalanine/L-methionine N-acetyltransferase
MEKTITTPLPEQPARPEVTGDQGKVLLRPLRVEDAQAFHAMQQLPGVSYHANVRSPFDSVERTREWIAKLAPPTVAIAAELGGALVGHVELNVNGGRRAHSARIGIGVHDDWQGLGIGSRLLAELIDVAHNWLGLRRLELDVFTDNAAALALYRKFGFEIEATYRGRVLREGKLVDAYLMARLADAVPVVSTAGNASESAGLHAPKAPGAIVVRALEASDMDAVAELVLLPGVRHGTLLPSFMSPQAAKERFGKQDENAIRFCATVDGRLAGILGLHVQRPRSSHCGTFGIMVHDDYVGRGVGTALLAAAIECADRSLGLRRIELAAYADNAPAIALYRKFGFVEEGCSRGDSMRAGQLVDTLHMARLAAAPPFVQE